MQAAKDAAGEEGEDAEEEEIDPDDVRYACLNRRVIFCFFSIHMSCIFQQTDNP